MNYLASIMCSSVELSGLHLYAELDERMRRKAADKDLYKSAVERWELILKYLALPSSIDNNQKSVSQLTRDLFIYNGFVKEGERDFSVHSMKEIYQTTDVCNFEQHPALYLQLNDLIQCEILFQTLLRFVKFFD